MPDGKARKIRMNGKEEQKSILEERFERYLAEAYEMAQQNRRRDQEYRAETERLKKMYNF